MFDLIYSSNLLSHKLIHKDHQKLSNKLLLLLLLPHKLCSQYSFSFIIMQQTYSDPIQIELLIIML